MEAHLLLADFAQAEPSTGKVNALGLGWSVTSTPTPHHALVVVLKVGWDETNASHHMILRLLTADGQQADVPTPFGVQPLTVEVDFEVGRPPGTMRGQSIDHSTAINVGPGLPLTPGRYEWRLQIGDEQRDEWRAAFTVRPQS